MPAPNFYALPKTVFVVLQGRDKDLCIVGDPIVFAQIVSISNGDNFGLFY
ncbi:hypothetical protein HC761_02380 [bacterium]|nr:hypothetical protein [bacterium]